MKKQKELTDLKENTEIEALTQLFKVLSDPTRMRILFLKTSEFFGIVSSVLSSVPSFPDHKRCSQTYNQRCHNRRR